MRPRIDEPDIPADVEPRMLDKAARLELKSLTKENAERVAGHLVMAARLIDDEPATAHLHAVAAARHAGRISVVRETLAITAYRTEDYALALRELRTYRRLSGRNDQLPMMVDSERGLGRPERALELGRSVPRSELEPAVRVELAIAMSGARLDLEQTDAALGELQIPELDPERVFAYSPDLFDAYGAVLEELGRAADAERWTDLADRARRALAEHGLVDDDLLEVIDTAPDADDEPDPGNEPDSDDEPDVDGESEGAGDEPDDFDELDADDESDVPGAGEAETDEAAIASVSEPDAPELQPEADESEQTDATDARGRHNAPHD